MNLLLPIKRFIAKPDVYIAGMLESMLINRSAQLTNAPLFILGLPRSGTTLVYQEFLLYV